MRYFSLFTGIGGFELGIQKAYESNIKHSHISKKSEQKKCPQGGVGSTDERKVFIRAGDKSAPLCVGYSEINEYAIQIYQKHFPEHKNYGDITEIKEQDLPDFDLLCGGFPCQSFSIAGKRRGFRDTRGTLFFDICRIIRFKRPSFLLLENVKGLLSHDEGRTFATIITTLDELGYDIQWQVLNSKSFGVPQNRERVFIIGHLRGTPRPSVFPITGKTETITKNVFIDESQWRREGKLREYQGSSPTLNTAGGGGHLPLILSKTVRSGGRSSPHKSKQNWDSYEVAGKIRRLTPIECERLQGFPDNWTKKGVDNVDLGEYSFLNISDSQRYKCLGNAVTVNVIQAIAEKL